MRASAGKLAANPFELNQKLAKLSRPWVFTNGCFDLLHRGHVTYLEEAANLGGALIVGLNSDTSIKRLNKGADRPINNQEDRAAILAALESVSLVTIFDDDTPLALIKLIQPDHLVKGGDWIINDIVGAREVQALGGQVHSIPFQYQRSTTNLLARIRDPM